MQVVIAVLYEVPGTAVVVADADAKRSRLLSDDEWATMLGDDSGKVKVDVDDGLGAAAVPQAPYALAAPDSEWFPGSDFRPAGSRKCVCLTVARQVPHRFQAGTRQVHHIPLQISRLGRIR